MQTAPMPTVAVSKVLSAGSSQGRRVELMEYGDGSLAIVCDGTEQSVYRQGAGTLELCVKVYLEMLRSQAGY